MRRECIFTPQMTKILKGLGILLLLVHHALLPCEDAASAAGIVTGNLISLGKICVAVFALLSGFGMYSSWKMKGGNDPLRFSVLHILKLYGIFWATVIPLILLFGIPGGGFERTYGLHPVYFTLLDLFGLSYYAFSPMFVKSWWYLSAALLYYALFPVLAVFVRRFGKAALWAGLLLPAVLFFVPGMSPVPVYGCVFLFGMAAAEEDLVSRLAGGGRDKKIGLIACIAVFLVLRQVLPEKTGRTYYFDVIPAFLLMLVTAGAGPAAKPGSAAGSGLVAEPESAAGPNPEKGGFAFLSRIGECSFEIYLIHGVIVRFLLSYLPEFPGRRPALLLMTAAISFVMAFVMRKIRGFAGRYTGAPVTSFIRNAGKPALCACAAASAACLLALAVPEAYANGAYGAPIRFAEEEIQMTPGSWKIPGYASVPHLYRIANIAWASDSPEVVTFMKGILFAHEEGETDVRVILPHGDTAEIHVVVASE